MLEACGISKSYGAVRALSGVDLVLRPGSVHAVLGENGAGKSTLMKVLFGLTRPDAGEILVNGRRVTLSSPAHALRLGIGMVHQHFTLVPTLTASENVALGQRAPLLPFRPGAQAAELEARARRLGLQLDASARVETLSVGERQRLEVLKALVHGARILILDEPTGVLSPPEVRDLFQVLRRLRDEGTAIAFISHKLWEVQALADEVTVLRSGSRVLHASASDVTADALVRAMVGTGRGGEGQGETTPATSPEPGTASSEGAAPALALRDVHLDDGEGRRGLKGLSLEVRAGEILGVAGVEGNGQREMAEAVLGLHRPTSGTVSLLGEDVTRLAPAERRRRGLSYIPEDRHGDALILPFSVRENLSLVAWSVGQGGAELPGESRGPWLGLEASRRNALELIRRYDIRVPSPEVPVQALSGGNQQKVVVAREMSRRPRVLLAANPTRGLDIGASAFVHDTLRRYRAEGGATLLVSSELEELLALGDRIAVLSRGRIVATVPPSVGREELGRLMLAGEPQS